MITAYGPQGLTYPDGTPAANDPVTVTTLSGELATLFEDPAGTIPLANPVNTDDYGNLLFFAEDGWYQLVVRGYTQRIHLEARGELAQETTLADSVELLELIRAHVAKEATLAALAQVLGTEATLQAVVDQLAAGLEVTNLPTGQATEATLAELLGILVDRSTSAGGAHLVGGSATKWRREFNDPTLSDWDKVANGMDFTVAGGIATVAMGTTNGASVMLTSKQAFTAPFKVGVGVALSQKIAGNEVYIELVAENDDGTVPDDPAIVAAWRISGTDSTTTSIARTEVRNGGAARAQSANISSMATQTGAGGIYEITLESDEVWFTSKAPDSTVSRAIGQVRNSISPDPNKRYRVRLRLRNGAVPASNTTVTFSFATAVDYTEIQTEVTGGNGNAAAGQAIPVTVVQGTLGTVSSTFISASASVAGTSIAKLLSAASVNNTLVKGSAGRLYGYHLSNTSAAWRYVKLYNKATAPVAGTDTPVMTIPLGPGQSVAVRNTVPVAFAAGIGYAITGAAADNDATAVAAGDVVGHLLWL